MKIKENWTPEYIAKLEKHNKAIEFMEKMYGIGIDEWDSTMNPLHYLDALEYFYKVKKADINGCRYRVIKLKLGAYSVEKDGKLLQSIFRLKKHASAHMINLINVENAIRSKISNALGSYH